MARTRIIRLSAIFASLCLCSISLAGIIELQVKGQITSSTFASVPVGTTLTADLFYDPTAAAISNVPNSADYPEPQLPVLDFGGSTLTSASGSAVNILLDNTLLPNFEGIPAGDDGIYWEGTPTAADATGAITSDSGFNSTGFSTFSIYFAAPHGNGVLTSTNLPTTFPALSQWATAAFYYLPVTGGCAGTCGNFAGTITSVQVASTPEPNTVLLSALSLISAFRLRGRLRKTVAKSLIIPTCSGLT
jgi:hypothetical protein